VCSIRTHEQAKARLDMVATKFGFFMAPREWFKHRGVLIHLKVHRWWLALCLGKWAIPRFSVRDASRSSYPFIFLYELMFWRFMTEEQANRWNAEFAESATRVPSAEEVAYVRLRCGKPSANL